MRRPCRRKGRFAGEIARPEERREGAEPFAKGLARLAKSAGGPRQVRPRAPRKRPGAFPALHPPFGWDGRYERRARRLKQPGKRSVC